MNSSLPSVAGNSEPTPIQPSDESKTGYIFNIMRFSTHDGPGIRTTVFLKGCPLSCWWCHNPESWNHAPSTVYHPERCIGCGTCIEACPSGALALTPQGVAADPLLCRRCGRCADVCPSEARERTARLVSAAELASAVERDLLFYDQSGGGVTFSGGEPLCQPEFLEAALEACGRRGIHRAVDTSGHADSGVLLAVARHTDLFLYDLKTLDAEKHRAETGTDNSTILKNLELLSASGAEIAIRIPLIPGVNDDAESIAAFGGFIAGLRQKHAVHLLPYHPTAAGKYKKLGLAYRGSQIQAPAAGHVAEIARRLSRFGLTLLVGG